MSKLSFNIAPYYDDYISSKNFLKVLFKPGLPVQVRELNQIQSILQTQIERFANNIFKDGSRVTGGSARLSSYDYIRLEPKTYNYPEETVTDVDIDFSFFKENLVLKGRTSTVIARGLLAVNEENDDPPTIYLIYTSPSTIDNETQKFIPGEIVDIYDDNVVLSPTYSVKIKCPSCPGNLPDTIEPLGMGSIFSIDAGVFYKYGFFIETGRQSIIINKYSNTGSNYKVGFNVIQSIIDVNDNSSLYDNALGYPNFSAPGADRYNIDLILAKRTLDTEDGDSFLLLGNIKGGSFQNMKDEPDYSVIMDTMAKRTYEINGNFTVSPFSISFMEEKKKDENDSKGYSITGSEDNAVIALGPGLAYVKGYRYDLNNNTYLQLPKARTTNKIKAYSLYFDERTNIYLRPLNGYSAYPNKIDNMSSMDDTIIDVYDGAFSNDSPTGEKIGTFKVYDVRYVDGEIDAQEEADRAYYKYYIYDLSMNAGKKITDGISFVDHDGINYFKASKVGDKVIVYNPGKTELLWNINKTDIKSLRDISDLTEDPSGSIDIVLRKTLYGTISAEGTVSFSAQNETFESYDIYNTLGFIKNKNSGEVFTIDLTSVQKTFNNNTINITLGQEYAGYSFGLLHDVRKSSVKENSKLALEKIINNVTPTLSEIFLGISDAYQIEYVKEIDEQQNIIDITENFKLFNNIYDNYYGESSIKVFNYELNNDVTWSIKVKYFGRDNKNLGYTNIDSYRDIIADDVLNYEDILNYTTANKTEYFISDSFDFRPSVISGTVGVNFVPSIGTTCIFDIEYYLGRTDLLYINKDGSIRIAQGQPSDSPTPISIRTDENMILYHIILKPYIYDITDISYKFIENKRYTMRDIGKIEDRIKRIEYYTALNLLEKKSADMRIKDEDGLDRFKNGFVADNFLEFQAGDVNSYEFCACIDRDKAMLRPMFLSNSKKLKVNREESQTLSNDNIYFKGNTAYIKYDSIPFDYQLTATRSVSINPYFMSRIEGKVVLTPNNDCWSDTTRLPPLTIDIDTGVSAMYGVISQLNNLEQNIASSAAGSSTGGKYGWWGTLRDQIVAGKQQYLRNGWIKAVPPSGPPQESLDVAQRLGVPGYAIFGKTWGDWHAVNQTTSVVNQWSQSIDQGSGWLNETWQTHRIDTGWQRQGVGQVLSTQVDKKDLGERVTDVQIKPYIRSMRIAFHATGLKPNCKVNIFFDGEDVTLNSFSTLYNMNRGTTYWDGLQMRTQAIGEAATWQQYIAQKSEFVTDQNGEISGVFVVPEGRFFCGKSRFRISSAPSIKELDDLDYETTFAETTFFSGGLDVTKQQTTMNILKPVFGLQEEAQYSGSTEWRNVLVSQWWQPKPPPPPPPAPRGSRENQATLAELESDRQLCENAGGTWFGNSGGMFGSLSRFGLVNIVHPCESMNCPNCSNCGGRCRDPLAQSFLIANDTFVTGIDLYFASADTIGDDISVQLRTMQNGYPTGTVLIEKTLKPHNLNVSTDSSLATHVEFDYPIYCKGGEEYCFVVGGYSPETRLWVSRMSEKDKLTNIAVTKQPAGGVCFRSSNSSTWNAEQNDDIKYVLYKAAFQASEMSLVFEPENELVRLKLDCLESEEDSNAIRIYHPHGFNINDKIKLYIGSERWFKIIISSGYPVIGQTIRTIDDNFTAIVKNIRKTGNDVEINLERMQGTFTMGENWICDPFDTTFRDVYLLESMNSWYDGDVNYPESTGTFNESLSLDFNGIPEAEILKQHTIIDVDNSNSFIINTISTATSSGFFGGDDIYAEIQQHYETFNVSGSYLTYNGPESWTYTGIGHNPLNGELLAYDYEILDSMEIDLKSDISLSIPHKMTTTENSVNGTKQVKIIGTISNNGNYGITPAVNLDTFTMVYVTNFVEWITSEDEGKAPNESSYFPECHPELGSNIYKYVTIPIRLKESATDLVIAYDVYKDISADYDIWLKKVNSNNPEDIDELRWMRVVGINKQRHSTDLNDRVEFEFNCSNMQFEVYTTDTDFTTESWDDEPFSSFKVKITGKTKNPAKPPMFQSFRAIAVT